MRGENRTEYHGCSQGGTELGPKPAARMVVVGTWRREKHVTEQGAFVVVDGEILSFQGGQHNLIRR